MESMKKSIILTTLAILIFGMGFLSLLALAYDRGILSPRELGGGMLVFVVCVFFLMMLLAKRTVQKHGRSLVPPGAPIDDVTRRRILRAIRTRKIWIGVLALCFPFGIANAVTHQAYLPMLTGGAMSLLIMYVAREDIKRLRKRLSIDANSLLTRLPEK